jgi:hypothetical protein
VTSSRKDVPIPLKTTVTASASLTAESLDTTRGIASEGGSLTGETHKSEQSSDGVWTAETELHLFDSIEQFPPLGINKYFNLASLSTCVEQATGVQIPSYKIWSHLKKMYNLVLLVHRSCLL